MTLKSERRDVKKNWAHFTKWPTWTWIFRNCRISPQKILGEKTKGGRLNPGLLALTWPKSWFSRPSGKQTSRWKIDFSFFFFLFLCHSSFQPWKGKKRKDMNSHSQPCCKTLSFNCSWSTWLAFGTVSTTLLWTRCRAVKQNGNVPSSFPPCTMLILWSWRRLLGRANRKQAIYFAINRNSTIFSATLAWGSRFSL